MRLAGDPTAPALAGNLGETRWQEWDVLDVLDKLDIADTAILAKRFGCSYELAIVWRQLEASLIPQN